MSLRRKINQSVYNHVRDSENISLLKPVRISRGALGLSVEKSVWRHIRDIGFFYKF
jgi:hypothetical protein